jgi:phosphoenolpyruvate carboxykinase (ATP)
LENINFIENTSTVDFADFAKTENTRVSYPIEFIDNYAVGSKGGKPTNIFFLTADAYGVLPPISKLTKGQAMYHFISGYTAKVAGTEVGVTEPQATFSACFGKAFLPLHPTKYAEMLGEKITSSNVNVWLINTGWSGGSYGVGSRIKLSYTRSLITAALNGELDKAEYGITPYFGLNFPKTCSNVPTEILEPKNAWADKEAFAQTAQNLAGQFVKNFEQYASAANEEILSAAPKAEAVKA